MEEQDFQDEFDPAGFLDEDDFHYDDPDVMISRKLSFEEDPSVINNSPNSKEKTPRVRYTSFFKKSADCPPKDQLTTQREPSASQTPARTNKRKQDFSPLSSWADIKDRKISSTNPLHEPGPLIDLANLQELRLVFTDSSAVIYITEDISQESEAITIDLGIPKLTISSSLLLPRNTKETSFDAFVLYSAEEAGDLKKLIKKMKTRYKKVG